MFRTSPPALDGSQLRAEWPEPWPSQCQAHAALGAPTLVKCLLEPLLSTPSSTDRIWLLASVLLAASLQAKFHQPPLAAFLSCSGSHGCQRRGPRGLCHNAVRQQREISSATTRQLRSTAQWRPQTPRLKRCKKRYHRVLDIWNLAASLMAGPQTKVTE